MTGEQTFVIVGASLAGVKAAETLRAEGFGGRVVLIGAEAEALNQGPAAARSMLGRAAGYDLVPCFFSDQYDVGMEYAGFAPGIASSPA